MFADVIPTSETSNPLLPEEFRLMPIGDDEDDDEDLDDEDLDDEDGDDLEDEDDEDLDDEDLDDEDDDGDLDEEDEDLDDEDLDDSLIAFKMEDNKVNGFTFVNLWFPKQ